MVSFSLSLLSLLFSFLSTILTQPSICTSEMLGTISQSNYQDKFTEKKIVERVFIKRLIQCCLFKKIKVHNVLIDDKCEPDKISQNSESLTIENKKDIDVLQKSSNNDYNESNVFLNNVFLQK